MLVGITMAEQRQVNALHVGTPGAHPQTTAPVAEPSRPFSEPSLRRL